MFEGLGVFCKDRSRNLNFYNLRNCERVRSSRQRDEINSGKGSGVPDCHDRIEIIISRIGGVRESEVALNRKIATVGVKGHVLPLA